MKKTILLAFCSVLLIAACSSLSTFDEFAALAIDGDNPKNAQYKVEARPIGFQNVRVNGQIFAKDFGEQGTRVFLHAKEDWNSQPVDAKQEFYLEVSKRSPCYGQTVCADPTVVEWYGPFSGRVGEWAQ